MEECECVTATQTPVSALLLILLLFLPSPSFRNSCFSFYRSLCSLRWALSSFCWMSFIL